MMSNKGINVLQLWGMIEAKVALPIAMRFAKLRAVMREEWCMES